MSGPGWRVPLALGAVAAALATTTIAGAAVDGPGGATTGGCAAPGVLFCEDFEALPPGAAASPDWAVDTEGGSLAVAAEAAGSANQVLKVRTEDNGRAFLRVDDFAAPGNRFFGRMRLRVEEFPTAPDFAHFVLVEATGPDSAELVRPVGGQFIPPSPPARFGIGADGGPTGDWTDHRESAPTADATWQCIEWSLDGADNRVSLILDGVQNPELTASTNTHGGNQVPFILPTVDTVKIGWQVFQGGTTPAEFDITIDDIALSTNPLGC